MPSQPGAAASAPVAVPTASPTPPANARPAATPAAPLRRLAGLSQRLPRRSRRRSRSPPPLETALSADPEPTLQPNTFFATAKASERYAAIVDAGGWPTDIVALHPGAQGPQVAKLRKRLAIEGDLDPGHSKGQAWDAELTAAVKRFQARMGLQTDRDRRRSDAEGDQCSGRRSVQRARFQRQPPRGRQFPVRRSLCRGQSSRRLRSRRSRTAASFIAMSQSSAIPSIPRPRSPPTSRSSTSIRPGPCRPRSSRRKSFPRMQRDPGYLTRAEDPDPRRFGAGDQSEDGQLEHRATPPITR